MPRLQRSKHIRPRPKPPIRSKARASQNGSADTDIVVKHRDRGDMSVALRDTQNIAPVLYQQGHNSLMGGMNSITGRVNNEFPLGIDSQRELSIVSHDSMKHATTVVVINAAYVSEAASKNGNIVIGINAGKNLGEGRDNIIIGGDVNDKLRCDSIIIGSASRDHGDHTISINVAGETNRGLFTNAIAYGGITDVLGYIPDGVGMGRQIIATTASRRYKTQEHIVGRMPDVIDELVPVRAKWKSGVPTIATPGDDDIGLIAEDVARIWPEAVTYDDTGQISNVKYIWVMMLMLREIQYLRSLVRRI